MPKFLRAQRNYINKLNAEAASALGMDTKSFLSSSQEPESSNYNRETIEDLIQNKEVVEDTYPKFEKYQPVLYEIIKDPQQLADKESAAQAHERFIESSEAILKLHHQRAHVHDGLKHLSDDAIIKKIREAPTKLKKNAKSFLKKLEKHKVKLDNNGEVDLSEVKDDNVKTYLEKNLCMVRTTLMMSDLEFEYP